MRRSTSSVVRALALGGCSLLVLGPALAVADVQNAGSSHGSAPSDEREGGATPPAEDAPVDAAAAHAPAPKPRAPEAAEAAASPEAVAAEPAPVAVAAEPAPVTVAAEPAAVAVAAEPAAVAVAAEPAPPAVVAETVGAADATRDSGVSREPGRARDLSLPPETFKPWQIVGTMMYRALAITDDDPANDRQMIYRIQGVYEVLDNLRAFVRVGLDQRFVRVDDESGLRFDDTALGAYYTHALPLERLGWDRSVALYHRLRITLPTSFQSQQQDLIAAVDWTSRGRVHVVDQLFAGLSGTLQYRFHEYAEQAGLGGGTLPRFIAQALIYAEYSPLVHPRYGTLTVGADVHADETVDYPSRDPGEITGARLPPGTLATSPESFPGDSTTFAVPHFGYDLYVNYAPLQNVSISLSLEQASSVLSNGTTHYYFFNRDQTEVALAATLSY